MNVKRTPLFDEHKKLNAHMAPFGGWEMPLNYAGQIEEHNFVREDAGMFDVSHMNVVDFKGKDVIKFLHYLIANNVSVLKEGQALYSCMLNEKAGVVDDLIVYKINDEYFRMVINAATHDKDIAWLEKQITKFDVEMTEKTEFVMIAVQGPNAITKTQEVFTPEQRTETKGLGRFYGVDVEGWWIARTGYTGEDGYEIMVPEDKAIEFWQNLLSAGVKPCGLVCRDSLRLEAGMRLYGSDMNEDVSPLEASIGWSVAWQPEDRDFIGRKVLEQQKKDGVKNKLCGLILDKGKGILRSHQKVFTNKGDEGEITSGGFSPTLGHSIAFVMLPSYVKIGDEVSVEIRGKKIEGKIVKPVFVKDGKKV